jgi:peptidoglycan/xylan/chitin deacetylase (PgdA/CDA1 family)
MGWPPRPLVRRPMKRRPAHPYVDLALRSPGVERLARRVAGARGRGVALLWHRIRPEGPRPGETVRAVSVDDLAVQLDLLVELGDVVPLAALDGVERGRRPRFALTFDDDDPGHADHTLPLLVSRGLPATFFLSGRWRGDAGPYWWEVLEARIQDRGAGIVATEYGLPPTTDAAALARALTGTSHSAVLADEAVRTPWRTMDATHAVSLVAAGMEIGFHTLHHPSLPTLRDGALHAAVVSGRAELGEDLGTPLDRFAYPHGHVDGRVAAAVRAGGYVSGWTTAKRISAGGDDPMLHGRWDLGHLNLETFRAVLVRGLTRPGR